jgi:GGDEF domain-containing protein
MGEDEFVLVFPDRSPELVDAVRTRLFRAVIEAGREVCGEEIVRASFGEGQYPCDGQDAEELLVAADRRLFAIKRDRRAAFGLSKC